MAGASRGIDDKGGKGDQRGRQGAQPHNTTINLRGAVAGADGTQWLVKAGGSTTRGTRGIYGGDRGRNHTTQQSTRGAQLPEPPVRNRRCDPRDRRGGQRRLTGETGIDGESDYSDVSLCLLFYSSFLSACAASQPRFPLPRHQLQQLPSPCALRPP